jgi:urease accessory protein
MNIGMNMGMAIVTSTVMTMTMTNSVLSPAHLQRVQTWFSPSFPIGAFSYSHGLESAFEAGLVTSRQQLGDWIEGLLLFGSTRNDAILFVAAYQTFPSVEDVAQLAAALSPSKELRTETLNQGEAFLRAVRQAWPELALNVRNGEIALPVAAALACAAAAIPLRPSLIAYLHGFAANIVSAALRSMPVGQSHGLAVQAALEPSIALAVDTALAATLDDVGSATPILDWLSASHETQYSRLFRS